MFKNIFSFKGRIRRLEYGLSLIIFYSAVFIFISLFSVFQTFIGESLLKDIFNVLLIVPFLFGYGFLLTQAVKRSHDIGNSGWFILIPFYILFLLFVDGQYGKNKYGDNPKGKGNSDEIETIGNFDNV